MDRVLPVILVVAVATIATVSLSTIGVDPTVAPDYNVVAWGQPI